VDVPRGAAGEPVPVVVVGAGIGGLGVALALSRLGRRVTLLERDDGPLPASVEAAFGWDRRGAPQVRHSHGFAARLHRELRRAFPDVLDDLRAAGVVELDLGALLPPDAAEEVEDLTVLAARRTTYEWVLRRAVLRSPSVELRTGAVVRGLRVTTPGGPTVPRVSGVVLDDGGEVLADAVVATTGSRSDLARWLGPHGVTIPEVVTATGITYLTRFYRLRPGRPPAGGAVQTGRRRAGLSYSCVPADHGTFSITLGLDSADHELRRHLLDPGRFEAACRLLPGIEEHTAPGMADPLTDVQAMGGLINRRRSFLDDHGRPHVLGFHAVGDAHTTTNPIYGRGCSLAMVQAVRLRDAFAAHPDDAIGRAMSYEEASRREVEPWYRFAVDGDALRGESAPVDPRDPRFALDELLRVGAAEPRLLGRTLRAVTLLDTPDVLAADPLFVDTLASVRAERAARATARGGDEPRPHRDDLLRAGNPAPPA
jgi:2-polyprenyl-6-methoxyphenol hydroxylase-like FAD-dependent oxidoreductase